MNSTTDIKKYEQKEVCVKEDLKKIQFRKIYIVLIARRKIFNVIFKIITKISE